MKEKLRKLLDFAGLYIDIDTLTEKQKQFILAWFSGDESLDTSKEKRYVNLYILNSNHLEYCCFYSLTDEKERLITFSQLMKKINGIQSKLK